MLRVRLADLASQTAPPGATLADADLSGSVWRQAANVWGAPPNVVASAPGRIEIIGNHLDYNGGDVLAAAIDRWVAVAVRNRPDELVTLTAADLPHPQFVAPLAAVRAFDRRAHGEHSWSDYGQAVVSAMAEAGLRMRGADVFYRGTVPLGVGLASSSALLVAMTAAFATLAGADLDLETLTRLAETAEHRAGAPVGRLDQTAAAVGGVLRFAVDPQRVRRLDAKLGDAVFAVCDSGVRHGIPSSRYRQRVQECERALATLQSAGWPIAALADLTTEQLPAALELLPSPLAERVRHVVDEAARTRTAETLLEAGEVAALGRLMNESGRSSATLYDISHPAVEALASVARATHGVYGARMMGGGDGGTVLALIARDAVPALTQRIGADAVTVYRIARGVTLASP